MAILLTRRAVLQAAIEDSYGTEKAVTLNDGFYVQDPAYKVDTNVLERSFARDDLSPLAVIMGRKLASMTFTTELRGNDIENSGDPADAPLITRLFRASGYSLTAVAAAEAGVVAPQGNPLSKVTFAVDDAAVTNTDLITYQLRVATGGASGVAEIEVLSDTTGETSAPAVVTDGQPLDVGTKGLTVTPTITDDLVAGDMWSVVLYPTGLRLDPVSDNFESLTMVMNIDGVQHKMLGCYGTFQVTAKAGEFATIEWTFTGTYLDPTDVPLPDCNYEQALPQMVELARLYIGGFHAIVEQMTYNQQNDVQVRPDVSSKDGYIGTRIVSRAPEGGIDPEADLVANHDFWGKMAAAQRMPFQMRIGTKPGNTVWFLAPSTQYSGLTYQDRNGIRTYDAGLRYSRVNGNDEVCWFFA